MYKDTVIKRVDQNGKTTFYLNEISQDSPHIWVEYSGINDGFSGYLEFTENGKVSILSGDGYFQVSNHDTKSFDYRRIAAYERPELKENVYFIQDAIRYEQMRNKGTKTIVIVEYPQIY
jgi:hypothetical protein